MNNEKDIRTFDFLLSLSEIEPAMVQGTIGRVYKRKAASRSGSRRLGKTLLIAAVIASLFAAMCAGAYALNLFGLKDLIMPAVKGWTSDNSTVLSAQGLQSTTEFMAYEEFQIFYDDYEANDHYGDQVPQEMDQWMKEHSAIYFCYTDTLKAKLLEICDKYALKLRDTRYDNVGLKNLSAYIGVDDIITAEGYAADKAGFIAYDDGSFLLQEAIHDPSCGYIETKLIRNVKGYFSQGYLDFPEGAELNERSYTTPDGDALCVLSSGADAALIYDGEAAFVTMSLCLMDEGAIPDEIINSIADSINFNGLGKSSAVNEAAIVPPPEPYAPDTADTADTFAQVQNSLVDIGDSFYGVGAMEKLEISVNELTLSRNVFSAGWQIGDFDQYSYATAYDGDGALKTFSYPDYIDQSTGELIDGVSLLTVEINVTNRNTGDCDIGAGVNTFPYCLLHLTDISKMLDPYNASYADCIAYQSDSGASSHGACIVLAPGESKTYKLAYALDCSFTAENSYLATVSSIKSGLFLPISAASTK